MVAVKALLVVALTGCSGLNMSGDLPWVPLSDVGVPLVPETAATPSPPNTFRSTHPATTAPLRVVTYNVQYAPDPVAIAATITADPQLASAGLILFQEIEAYPDEGESRTTKIAAALGMGYVYVPARLKGAGSHGLAILSSFPITNVEKMDLPDSSHKTQHRIAISADIDVNGNLLHVIDVHLDTELAATERIAQLHPAVIDAPPASMVAGDFNMAWVEFANGVPVLTGTGASDQAPIVDSYMHALSFDTPAAGSGPTEHMFGVEQRLDAIYTRDLDVTFGAVERVGPSDHWPMWLDVTF
jgi:endonuclease/exonuclease/phosphatase family metal-dependent hydrolase